MGETLRVVSSEYATQDVVSLANNTVEAVVASLEVLNSSRTDGR